MIQSGGAIGEQEGKNNSRDFVLIKFSLVI